MGGRLSGKRAFVTAAGAGIGRATALAFHREGAAVVATDIDGLALANLTEDAPGIATERLDVTDAQAVAAAAARWPQTNVLFNAAGWVAGGTVLETSDADWARAIDLNVTAMMRMIRAFLPAMLDRGGGSIVNVASVASSVKRRARPLRLFDHQGRGHRPDQVSDRRRCVARACAATPSAWHRRYAVARRAAASTGDEAAARAAFIARQPMEPAEGDRRRGRLALVYLASDESGFTTGQTRLDGGWTN